MGNTYPKAYLDAKKLSEKELMVILNKEINEAYNKRVSTEKWGEYMYIKSWNVQVYVDRYSKRDDSHLWLSKESISRLFDNLNRPYFTQLQADSGPWGIKVYFVDCPRCAAQSAVSS